MPTNTASVNRPQFQHTLEQRLEFVGRRRRIIQEGLPLSTGLGLEISPLFAPLVTKNEANVLYCDSVDYATLCEREKHNPCLLELGLEVLPLDFVWTPGRLLSECSPSSHRYDYIVSSHVLEHVPDFLGYLYQSRAVLKDDGIIAFVLPNAKGSGEYFRSLTHCGDLVESYFCARSHPSPGIVYSAHRHCFHFENQELACKGLADVKRCHSDSLALDLAGKSVHSYIDAHCWAFTIQSFLDVMQEMRCVGLFDFDLVDVRELDQTKTGHCNEFYIKLRPNAPARRSYQFASNKLARAFVRQKNGSPPWRDRFRGVSPGRSGL